MGDVVGEETRPWSDCKGADVQVAELRLSPSYCCVQAGETECGTWLRRSCVDFDLIIGEINFFSFSLSAILFFMYLTGRVTCPFL